MPSTHLGRVCCGLGAVSMALLVVFFALIASGQRGGATFFSNPWLATTLLAAGTAATVAAAVGVSAVFRESERAVVVFVFIVLGVAVVMLAGAEAVFPH